MNDDAAAMVAAAPQNWSRFAVCEASRVAP